MPNRWPTRTHGRDDSPGKTTDWPTGAGAPPPPPLDALDDERLIAHPEAHDAFVVLYRRYVGPVSSYCRMRIGNIQDAEDVAAQVFMNAYAAFPPDDRATLRAWLFTIAHHAVVTHYRKHGARRQPVALTEDDLAALPDPSISPEAAAERDDDYRAIRSALEQLNDDQRRVIELRLAGLKGVEIAQVIGRSESAVKMLQFRAMKRLRTILEPTHDNADTSAVRGKDLADAL